MSTRLLAFCTLLAACASIRSEKAFHYDWKVVRVPDLPARLYLHDERTVISVNSPAPKPNVSSAAPRTMTLIDPSAGTVTANIQLPNNPASLNSIRDLAWADGSERIWAVTEAGEVFVVDLMSHSIHRSLLDPHREFVAVAWDPYKNRLILGTEHGGICDLTEGGSSCHTVLSTGAYYPIQFLRRGRLLFYGCVNDNDDTSLLSCLDLRVDHLLFRVEMQDHIERFAISGGRLWVISDSGRLLEFDLGGRLVSTRMLEAELGVPKGFLREDFGTRVPSKLPGLRVATSIAAAHGRLFLVGAGTMDNILLEYRTQRQEFPVLPSHVAVLPGLHTSTGVCSSVLALPEGRVAVAAKDRVLIGSPRNS